MLCIIPLKVIADAAVASFNSHSPASPHRQANQPSQPASQPVFLIGLIIFKYKGLSAKLKSCFLMQHKPSSQPTSQTAQPANQPANQSHKKHKDHTKHQSES
jgi:hypothetical protein